MKKCGNGSKNCGGNWIQRRILDGTFNPGSGGDPVFPNIDANGILLVPAISSNYSEAITDRIDGNTITTPSGFNAPSFVNNRLIFDETNNEGLILERSGSTIENDTQGEVVAVINRIYAYDEAIAAASGDANSTINYAIISTDVSDFATTGAEYIEQTNFGSGARSDFATVGANSNGSSWALYQNESAISPTNTTGSNDGEWVFFNENIDRLGIFCVPKDNPSYYGGELMFWYYCSRPLTTSERTSVVNYAHQVCFGDSSPVNYSIQTLTPTQVYQNSKYNYTGGYALNPTNDKIASVWDKGDTHYNAGVGDFHGIYGQISTDGGETFGSEFEVWAGSDPDSFTNASQGYDSNGRLHVVATKVEPDNMAGYTPIALVAKYSDDDGDTWSSEATVSGITLTGLLNTNGNIIENPTTGDLYCSGYEGISGGTIRVIVLRSTDSGVSWANWKTVDSSTFASGDSNEPINETSIRYIADNTILAATRVNGRNFIKYYLSENDGDTWSDLGRFIPSDTWQDDTAGTSSSYVHLIRLATFIYNETTYVAAITLNRGGAIIDQTPTYLRMYLGKASNIISQGVEGFFHGAGIKFHVDSIDLTNLDGYPDILFPSNDRTCIIRQFKDTNGNPYQTNGQQGSITDIDYMTYTIPESYLNKI